MTWDQMCKELHRQAGEGRALVFRRASWHPFTIVGRKFGQANSDTALMLVSYRGNRFTDWQPHSIDVRATDWELVELPSWLRPAAA